MFYLFVFRIKIRNIGKELYQIYRRSLQICKLREMQYIYFSQYLLYNKTMFYKESPLLQKLKHQNELELLQTELNDKIHELQAKQAKIVQLENYIAQMHALSSFSSKVVEDQTQCSFEDEGYQEQTELVKRLGEVLNAREQEGVGLHLATQEMEEEMAKLKLTIQSNQEEIQQLRERIESLGGYLMIGMRDFDLLSKENKVLKERNLRLESEMAEKDNRILELQIIENEYRAFRQQKSIITSNYQNLQKQGEELRQQNQRLSLQLEMQRNEFQNARGAINSYDWKLFCLQTELDLCSKQKKQLKLLNEKQELRLNEMEVIIKEQRITVFSGEEEIGLLSSENKYLRVQSQRRQQRIDKLLTELDLLREQFEQQEQWRELEYRLKEKDEELKEIMIYLKQKISQLEQAKYKASSAEKKIHQLLQKLQKAENQNYQLQQNIVEHEQIMESQSVKIQKLEKDLEELSKVIQENGLISILRNSEWNNKKSEWCKMKDSLEATISNQSQKINDLSVQIIERDIVMHKKSQKLVQVQLQLEKTQEDLLDMFTRISNAEQMVAVFEVKTTKMECLMLNYQKQHQSFQLTIKDHEKLIQIMKDQIKEVQNDNSNLIKMVERYDKQLMEKKEQIKVLNEKAVDHIQIELNYDFQIGELHKQIDSYKKQKEELEGLLQKKQLANDQMRGQILQLHHLTQKKMQEVNRQRCQPQNQQEQTVKFEILDDDEDFERIESKFQKQQIQLKSRIKEYLSEVVTITQKFD